MSGLTVLVVDDEPLARRRILRLLAKEEGLGRIEAVGDVAEACRTAETLRPDILLLDIQMPGGDGFQLLDQLAQTPPAVVFVTAFDHHALRAFDAKAADYVTKPIEPGRFRAAMARARRLAGVQAREERIAELQETVAALRGALGQRARASIDFWVRARGDHLRVSADDVLWFQAERDYVRIHVAGANYLYRESLASLERRLEADAFARIHRSAIVRRHAIMKVRTGPFAALVAVLSDGTEVKVGRTYEPQIRAALGRT